MSQRENTTHHRHPRITPPYARRLRVEALEDRRMLAVLTVTTLSDSGAGSLREAVTFANGNSEADTIEFSVSGTISLDSQLPTITDSLAISGPGRDLLIVDAGGGADGNIGNGDGFRPFIIDDGDNANEIAVALHGITLTGGDLNSYGTLGGGAIWNTENLTITGSRVSRNSGHGGGIYNVGTVGLANSTVSENSGYGVWNEGTATLRTSIISGNSRGGLRNEGNVDVKSSTISENRGSGISNEGTLTVVGSTISRNRAISNSGGGIYNLGTATIISSTLFENWTFDFGTGIFSPSVSSTTISSSIVASSLFSLGDDLDGSGSLSGSHNLIGDGSRLSEFTNSIQGNPLLGPLTNNGGPTKTHALLPGSPAINEGDPATTETNDQRKGLFVRNYGGGVDIGSYELQTVANLSLVVDTTSDENDGDYSAGNLSLREAIGQANGSIGSNSISFEETLFGSNQTIALNSQLPTVSDAVTITGPGRDLLTLDAGGGIDGVLSTGYADGFRHFMFDDGDNSKEIEVALSGVTLTGGDPRINKNFYGDGGSIWNAENLTITSSTITGNSARSEADVGGSGGGAIFNRGTANINNSILSENSARYFGGGIFNNGTANVTKSTISSNSADGSGGGIWSDATTTLVSSTLSKNSTADYGGAILNDGVTTVNGSILSGNIARFGGALYNNGTATVTSSTISENTAEGGGGIQNRNNFSAGELTIKSSKISNNTARWAGGIYHFGNDLAINGSSISRNTASQGSGGGIYSRSGISITQSIVEGNSASRTGGGIHHLDSVYGPNDLSLEIKNSTISGNLAGTKGGGIFNTFYGSTSIKNSTLLGNSAEQGDGVYINEDASMNITGSIVANSSAGGDLVGTGYLIGSYSLIGDGSYLSQFTNSVMGNPKLGPLADNGGPTQSHALLPGSPALNAGDPSIPFLATEHDQRGIGYSRVAFDRIDMGAYEAHVTPSADFDADGDVDGTDFLTWQRGFGMENAVRADGNSDDDSDVDASDLAAWSLTYGEGAAPLAAGQPIEGEGLLSAARAWELLDESANDAAEFSVEEQLNVAVPVATERSVRGFASVGIRNAYRETESGSERREEFEPWLSDELLEQVFG